MLGGRVIDWWRRDGKDGGNKFILVGARRRFTSMRIVIIEYDDLNFKTYRQVLN
jgi:hypothetical protein